MLCATRPCRFLASTRWSLQGKMPSCALPRWTRWLDFFFWIGPGFRLGHKECCEKPSNVLIPLPVVTRDAETQKPLFQGLADAFKAKWGRVLFVRACLVAVPERPLALLE